MTLITILILQRMEQNRRLLVQLAEALSTNLPPPTLPLPQRPQIPSLLLQEPSGILQLPLHDYWRQKNMAKRKPILKRLGQHPGTRMTLKTRKTPAPTPPPAPRQSTPKKTVYPDKRSHGDEDEGDQDYILEVNEDNQVGPSEGQGPAPTAEQNTTPLPLQRLLANWQAFPRRNKMFIKFLIAKKDAKMEDILSYLENYYRQKA